MTTFYANATAQAVIATPVTDSDFIIVYRNESSTNNDRMHLLEISAVTSIFFTVDVKTNVLSLCKPSTSYHEQKTMMLAAFVI